MDLTMDSKKRSSTAEGGIPLWSAAPDYRKLLTYFFRKHSPGMVPKVDKLLDSYRGKEAKLMLMLAKKHDCSNPLNRIFVDRAPAGLGDGGGDRDRDYLALTTLYLSVFYPQDVDQAAALCKAYEGEEEEMFAKLSQNFHAINPLKMKKRSDEPTAWSRPVDYKRVLTGFYAEHDAGRVADVDQVLTKCKGREATLFSVFALKYDTENALNAVFEDRLKDTECADHVALLKLYLFIYHPSCMPDAKLMLSKYQGKEEELFSKLATKFRACNPLDVCAAQGKILLGSIDEAVESSEGTISDMLDKSALNLTGVGGYASPKRRAHATTIPQSPKVTP